MSPLMTPGDVAKLWLVSVRTVKRHVKEGRARVAPCMLTPFVRWRRSEVEADLQGSNYRHEAAALRPSIRERRTL